MRKALFLCILLLSLQAAAQESSSDKTLRQFCEMGLPCYEGNEVELLPSADIKFRDMMDHIRQARRYVHVEYYIFRVDSIGRALFSLLGEKMRQGVDVRVMYDSFGSRGGGCDTEQFDAFIDSVRQTGMPLCEFDTRRFPVLRHLLCRDHRKLVIIDDETAYIGGINVADYYIHGKPELGEWRDMHVRISGPSVEEFIHLFDVMWYTVSGELLGLEEPAVPSPSARRDMSGASRSGIVSDVPLVVTAREPYWQRAIMRDTYVTAIDNATHLIQIVNPYLTNIVPTHRALVRALRRGVRVELMVSANCDEVVVPEVMGVEMKDLCRQGAHIYYYEGGFHHTKVMTCDDTYCTVGSTNLDGRSLRFNYELNAWFFSPEVTRQLQDIFESDKRDHCTEVFLDDFKERFTPGQRFVGHTLGTMRVFL